MSLQKIIVTGGAGFIGSHTCEALLKQGVEVLALDNLSTGHLSNLAALSSHAALRFEELDITQGSAFDTVVRHFKPSAIIHLAALVSVQESIAQPDLNFERNVYASHCVAEAARRHEVKRIVFASSAAIFGDNTNLPLNELSQQRPLSPYGAAKLASENLFTGGAYTYNFSVVANRYFNVYGPRQDPKSPYSGVMSIFLDRFRSGRAVTVFGDGQQTRDFIYVGDVAQMNATAALSSLQGFHAFNVCTGRSTSLLELIAAFRAHFPQALETLFGQARKGDIIHSLGAPNAAKQVLDFEAKTQLAAGLKYYLAAEGIHS
ncbi:MAG: UDP-glucose 4-epimerase [Lentimonas sp.]|jgi:UDP-glucose 4-epimerase